MKPSFITIVKVLLAILVLWFLVHSAKLDFGLLVALLTSPTLLSMIIVLYFTGIIASAWRWYLLNKVQNIPLPFTSTILPTYLGIAFNNLLPGGVGGDFFRCYFLFKKLPDNRCAMMLSVLFDRMTGLAGIFVIMLVGSLYLNFLSVQSNIITFIGICLASCFGLLALFLAFMLLAKKMAISNWLSVKFQNKKWLATLHSLFDALRIYRDAKMVILKCLIASVVVQIIIAVICLLIAKMMHFPSLSFFDYLVAIAITQIVSLIPITPGGFGIGEATFANVLIWLNPTTTATFATIFLAYRIIGIILYLPSCVIFLLDRQLLQQPEPYNL